MRPDECQGPNECTPVSVFTVMNAQAAAVPEGNATKHDALRGMQPNMPSGAPAKKKGGVGPVQVHRHKACYMYILHCSHKEGVGQV